MVPTTAGRFTRAPAAGGPPGKTDADAPSGRIRPGLVAGTRPALLAGIVVIAGLAVLLAVVGQSYRPYRGC